MAAERKIEALRASSIFAELPESSLARIAEMMQEFDAPAGRVLIEPRQKGSGMFVIEEGVVQVMAPGGKLRECGPGEVVGELALLTREATRTARVQAKTDVRCLALPRAEFHQMLCDEPAIAVSLLDVVATRLAEGARASG